MRNSKGFASLEIRIPGRESRGFQAGPVRRNSSNGAAFVLRELPVVIAVIGLLTAVPPPSLQRAGAGALRGGTFGAWDKVRFQTNTYRRVGCCGCGSYGLFIDGSAGRIGL